MYTMVCGATGFLSSYTQMSSADSTDALVALSPELGEDEIFIVLTWGAQLGYAANQELLGTAEDLDMYVSFLADAESDERCLLYYGVTSCGDAKLVRSDQLTVPSSVTSVIAEADEYGVESIRLTSLRATTYTVFIRNSGLEQPTERAEIKVDVFNVDGLVSRVDQPAACDATDNTTARELCGDDYDSPLFVDPGSDKTTPVWSTPESNREQAEWYRALCIDNTGDAPVVSEVQRYFTSSAWAYAQVIDGCPPSVDTCDSGGADDGYWYCSADLGGGIYSCPKGLASLLYCPDGGTCQQTQAALPINEDPRDYMC